MDVAEEFDLHEELPPEIDPKQELADDVARVRAERDTLEQQLAADRETLEAIRTAIDKVVETVWRDVYSQQQTMRSKENITAAFTLSFFGSYQWPAVIVAFLIAAGAIFALQAQGAIVAIGLYLVLAA